MGLAILESLPVGCPRCTHFQFPFRRDGPCDPALADDRVIICDRLSVPFSSGWALRSHQQRPWWWEGRHPFSSLFVGMGLAMARQITRLMPLVTSFSSLFVGMGLAIVKRSTRCYRSQTTFSSLFVGMGLAIQRAGRVHRAALCLSVPFSSGWALRLPRVR